jgi:uncharacterized protein YneF (UPF0154 family)
MVPAKLLIDCTPSATVSSRLIKAHIDDSPPLGEKQTRLLPQSGKCQARYEIPGSFERDPDCSLTPITLR